MKTVSLELVLSGTTGPQRSAPRTVLLRLLSSNTAGFLAVTKVERLIPVSYTEESVHIIRAIKGVPFILSYLISTFSRAGSTELTEAIGCLESGEPTCQGCAKLPCNRPSSSSNVEEPAREMSLTKPVTSLIILIELPRVLGSVLAELTGSTKRIPCRNEASQLIVVIR